MRCMPVKVTMQAEGSPVEWTYVSYVCKADMGRTQLVTLEIPDNRRYVYMVYLDGALSQRTEIGGS